MPSGKRRIKLTKKSEKMEKTDNFGTAYKFVRMVWDNNKTDSWLRLNTVLYDALNLAIDANMDFEITDFDNIFKNMQGGYWFGVNSNGKGYGEYFYKRSIDAKNTSAIKSFENWNNIKPFILKGKRMCISANFFDGKFQYKITGFSEDYKRIYAVAYLLDDINKEGKKKLFNFDKKEWLKFRKSNTLTID